MQTLNGKTVIVTGSSRGIGLAIALRCAKDGANVVIAAKSEEPHPKMGGSIHESAAAVKAAGGNPLPVVVDVRDEAQVQSMIEKTVQTFGGIDVIVNNAGAISLTTVEMTPIKRYDVIQGVNTRALFLVSSLALPYLKQAKNPHIISLSPPLNLDPKWLAPHAPYTVSKYGMTMLALGMAGEFKGYGIAVNCLWPRTIIATAAIEFVLGGRRMFRYCRTTDIVADAAYMLMVSDSRQVTGQTLIDEAWLRTNGCTDFTRYAYDPEHPENLRQDLFVE